MNQVAVVAYACRFIYFSAAHAGRPLWCSGFAKAARRVVIRETTLGWGGEIVLFRGEGEVIVTGRTADGTCMYQRFS